MPFYAWPSLLSACFFCGVGIFVLTRNVRNLINWSLAIGLLGSALVQYSHFMLLLTHNMRWYQIAHMGQCLCPGSFALFSVTFARRHFIESLKQWKWLLASIIGLSGWFLYQGFSGTLVTPTHRLSFHRFDIYQLEPTGLYFSIFVLLSLVFILYNLENTYRHASDVMQWQVKYLILGIFAMSFFQVFLISYTLLYHIVRVEYFVAEAVIMLISGFLMLFSLVRHRLMDTDVFISRQIVYKSLVIFVTGTYLITIAIIGYFVKYRLIQQEITQFLVAEVFMYVAIIGLIALLLSESIRHKVERYISKHFYKHKYEYDEVWIAFTRQISSNISLESLLPQIIRSIQDIIHTDHVYIFLPDANREDLRLAASSLPQLPTITIPCSSEFVRHFRQSPTPPADLTAYRTSPALQRVYAEQQSVIESLTLTLCTPLQIEDTFLGLLAIGAEHTGEPYAYEDYVLLHTIGIQAASAILNAQLSENLSQARALETFHKFSAFIIHDLKNAVQSLTFVAQNAPDYLDNPEFRADALKTITDTVTRMNTLVTRLSSVPEKLEIHPITTVLAGFLEETLKHSKVTKLEPIRIHLEIQDPALAVPLDYHHFQSVVLNLLSNAAESITGDGTIRIEARQAGEMVILTISDTGCGIPEDRTNHLFTPFKSTKKKGLGIGLYQCKTIVEAHGGRISVESVVSQGTTFRIELPAVHKEIRDT